MKATVGYRVPPCWSCSARFETWASRDEHLREEPCRPPPPVQPARGRGRRPGSPLSHGNQRL
ncbi:MAG: hypothetical protein OXE43_07470 [Chloroflexi bacterium]|nr:hypothetical protein [Chloroflexota bacterium]